MELPELNLWLNFWGRARRFERQQHVF